ncbi:Sodium:solute symporter family protein [Candidatus Trichorickettsia mobilis]|uniref:Sodium:solute symporter family protein n=1 Tax=Candidatus Trichorickettsia mobilis TaxID=1346319 RepID=A0ABZ0UV13_9RICK|nr:sodium:solute symporter family protein [Candidatus Trichorickettsia mobilis]WPY00759.1 Sodium:solute symporter family protein [Candidatus Trichorickettsia mobilis]
MNMNIDTTIFIIYLIANVGFGLYWGRKNKTIQDYALGGRNFSTGTLVSTIMAGYLGGDYLFITLAQVYTTGLHYAIGCLGMSFGLLLVARIFVPKMGEFLGKVSIAEALGDLYGKRVRLIAAICGSVVASGFIALQFKVFATIFRSYLGISSDYAIYLAGFIVVSYSAFGGIRSIAFTDVIQFFTFGVLIPVLSIVIWHEYTNINGFDFKQAMSNPIFNPQEFLGFSNSKFWSLIFLFILFSLPSFDATLFQRVSIGRSTTQVTKAFTISSILLLLILSGMSWIGFLLFNVDPTLEPDNLVHYIINNYAHVGLKGFILVGLGAMCMSNADANLNSASVVLTHDFLSPLGFKFKNELILSKLIALTIGMIALFLASLDYDLLSLVFMTQSFNLAAMPLMLAILGFRTTEKSVLIGIVAHFICVPIWRQFFMDTTGIDSLVPGWITNAVFCIGSHYLLKQGGLVATKT